MRRVMTGVAVALAISMLSAASAEAAPFAYIPNFDGTVSVIDVGAHPAAIVATIANVGTFAISVAVARDGKRAYIEDGLTGAVSVIDTASNTIIASIPGAGTNQLTGIAVAPDGTRLYVTRTNALAVLDTASYQEIGSVSIASPFGIGVTPDGAHVYVTSQQQPTLTVVDATTNQISTTIPLSGIGYGVAVAPDGAHAYVANGSSTLSVIDTATNLITANVSVGSTPVGVAVTPDGARVYVANHNDGTVSVVDTSTNTALPSVISIDGSSQTQAFGVSVALGGTRVLVTAFLCFGNPPPSQPIPGCVAIIDTASNSVTTTIADPGHPIAFGNFMTPDPPPPTAVASATPSSAFGAAGALTPVLLSGAGSTEADGEALTYTWSDGRQTLATTHDPINTANVLLGVGTHTITLTVSNGSGGTGTATVVVDIQDAAAQLQQTQTALAAANAQVQQLQGQVAADATQIQGLQAQVATDATQIQALQTQVAADATQVAKLQTQVASDATQIQGLQTQVATGATQIQQLQGQLATAAATIAAIQPALNACTANATATQGDVGSLSASLGQVFNSPAFTIPGATVQQQIQNLSLAIGNLNHGQQQALYKNLGGK